MTITRTVDARNTVPNSPNPIHTEDARAHGFRGGIVPGLTLYSYAARPLVELWGTTWLTQGGLDLRFSKAVYDGERLAIVVEDDPSGARDVNVRVVGPDGTVRASGAADQHGTRPKPDPQNYPAGPTPDVQIEMTAEALRSLGPIPEVVVPTDEGFVDEYLAKHDEQHPAFREILPPAAIARVSAYVLADVFTLSGPRIHRGLVTTFYGTRAIGTRLAARGFVDRVWDHGGHGYLSTDLIVVDASDDVVMHIVSESIYRLGSK